MKKMESGEPEKQEQKLELVYTLFCDDVRLEVGNKLSYMGVFQNIVVPQLPVWLPKLAVVNHWRGDGPLPRDNTIARIDAAHAGGSSKHRRTALGPLDGRRPERAGCAKRGRRSDGSDHH